MLPCGLLSRAPGSLANLTRPDPRFAARLCRCLVYLPFRAGADAAPADLRHTTGKPAPAQGSPKWRRRAGQPGTCWCRRPAAGAHAVIALPPPRANPAKIAPWLPQRRASLRSRLPCRSCPRSSKRWPRERSRPRYSPAIRSDWLRPRSTCRPAAPAGSPAMPSSTCSASKPPSCRGSSRSAISTKTSLPLMKRRGRRSRSIFRPRYQGSRVA